MPLEIITPTDQRYYMLHGICLDITHRCILECPSCLRQEFPKLFKRGHDLTPKNLAKICDTFNDITFCGQMGDAIYHPKFHEMVKTVIDKGNRLLVQTNGHGKKDAWWDKSFEMMKIPARPERDRKKYKWTFDIDGLPKDSHKYRINQDGEAVFEVMKKGVAMGNHITWQYIIFEYNKHDIEEAKKMALDNGMMFTIIHSNRPAHTYGENHELYVVDDAEYINNV